MQALSDELVALAQRQPVLLVLEDAHWLDPSTLELLQLHLDRCAETRLLIVITSRPDHQPALAAHPHVTRLTLNRLGRAGVAAIVEALSSGATLPTAVIDAIIARTDGVPLFVEEMTKAVLESGTGDALRIPASLHDSLMARLDRLPDVKEVAQAAACIGRVFDYELLAAVAGWPEAELPSALAKLAAAELVFRRGTPPDASYTFKHALVQDAAYESLLRSRRQEMHRQIVLALTERFPEQAAAEPDLLAQHYALAGMAGEAGAAWHHAGQQALARSAGREAIGHLTRGLAQLALLSENPGRVIQELAMQRLLGTACMNVHGYAAPEVMRAFGRAWELCGRVAADEDAATFPVLFGIWIYQLTRAQHARAAEAAADLLQRVQQVDDQGARIAGFLAKAVSLSHIGRPSDAQAHYAMGTALCGSAEQPGLAQRFGLHPGICIHAYQAWCLTTLGYPDQARRSTEQSQANVEGIDHVYTHSRRLYWQAVLYQMQGDWATVQRLAAEAIAVAEEQGYAMVVACGHIMHGAAIAATGDPDAGISELREGIRTYRETGARFQGTYHLALLADALGANGHPEEGHASLDQAFAFMEETGERLCEPDLNRLRGKLLRHQRSDVAAEASLQQALDVARQQKARWSELRASRDLARLWAERGERQQALDLLRPRLRLVQRRLRHARPRRGQGTVGRVAMTTIGAWLERLELGQFVALFEENLINQEVLADLTDADLKELGLPLGARKRILKAASTLVAAAPDAPPAAPPAAPSAAERRQLTVMFVDLVGSTALAERARPRGDGRGAARLPERRGRRDRALRGACRQVHGRRGAGLFRLARAHEDEAERAVRAGLAIVGAVGRLDRRRRAPGLPDRHRHRARRGRRADRRGSGAASRRWSARRPTWRRGCRAWPSRARW